MTQSWEGKRRPKTGPGSWCGGREERPTWSCKQTITPGGGPPLCINKNKSHHQPQLSISISQQQIFTSSSYWYFSSGKFAKLIGKIVITTIGRRMESSPPFYFWENIREIRRCWKVLSPLLSLFVMMFCQVEGWRKTLQLSQARRLTDTISGYLWQFAPAESCHLAPTGVK